MGRPKTIRDDQLLNVARSVFMKRGASGSTKEIAKAVGISEAALFKRYRTTKALFLSAMAPLKVNAEGIIREASRARDPHKALEIIAERALDYFRTAVPLMLPLITHPNIGLDALVKHMGQNPVQALRLEIMHFLYQEATRGRVSKARCGTAATLLVSAVHGIAIYETRSEKALPATAELTSLVDTLWLGLRPKLSRGRARPKGKHVKAQELPGLHRD